MTNYAIGARFEYKTATYFRRHGYFVIRAAGSHGPADLVAVKKGYATLLIQCKRGQEDVVMDERNHLYEAAQQAGAVPITACSVGRVPTVYRCLTGIATTQEASQVVLNEHFSGYANSRGRQRLLKKEVRE